MISAAKRIANFALHVNPAAWTATVHGGCSPARAILSVVARKPRRKPRSANSIPRHLGREGEERRRGIRHKPQLEPTWGYGVLLAVLLRLSLKEAEDHVRNTMRWPATSKLRACEPSEGSDPKHWEEPGEGIDPKRREGVVVSVSIGV